VLAQPLPSLRYRLLVEQMLADEREKRGQDWGAIAAVARRLEVKPQFLSMVLAGKRSGDSSAITRAVRALPLRADFFFDEREKNPHYTDYLGTAPRQRAAVKDPPHWRDFLENYEFKDELSPADLEMMRSFAGRRLKIRGWSDWVQLAEWIRQRKPSAVFEEKKRRDR
jgi:hypothetical protein